MAAADETQVRAEIAAERRELADVLAGLPTERWDEQTLCAGWRVRETAAHITMAFRYSLPKVVLGILKAGGSFNRMADRAARADADALTAEDLVASLRDNLDHPWKLLAVCGRRLPPRRLRGVAADRFSRTEPPR